MDRTEEIRNMLQIIYDVYEARGIPHVKEEL